MIQFFAKKITSSIPDTVTVVAATKYFDVKEMRALYDEGIHHFGENRVELLLEKKQQLQDLPITWHLIGTLQTKKTKKIINDIDYLHSLDSVKLAEEIHKRRTEPLNCFIQVNISHEESKHGLDIHEVIPFIKEIQPLKNVTIIGFMGMAAFTQNEEEIHQSFQRLNELQATVKEELGLELSELSIGMSNDYPIALKHNATFLRLGSVLFKREV